MNTGYPHSIARVLDIGYTEFLPFFEGFGEGLLITDQTGTVIYYNPTMAAIDELDPSDALGKKVVEIYDLTDDSSMIMQCLKNRQPIINRPLLYHTRRGKVANTIHTVFPLLRHGRLEGAICLVREYNLLEETISSVSMPRPKRVLPNETQFDFDAIVGSNIDFLRAVNTARLAAKTHSPVMLCGETGTGKELFAQAIHNQSERKSRSYTAVNCAAIPENLLEGLLFGTTSGAFTGARDKPGLFERASGGTIFLDELNSMATGLQAKILRVIQERKVRPLGSLRETEVDIKIISSVSKEPHVAIAENNLRPDLFYRLGVVFVPIPPLRERREDIVLLARHFVVKHSRALNRKVTDISGDVLELFNEYHWPGNVRELEHVIEGAINLVVSSLAEGVVGEMVGRTDGLEKRLADVGGQVGSLGQGDAVPSVLFDDGLKLVGDIVQGFVPGGFAPLSRAAFARADHGRLHALGVVKQGDAGRSARTQAAVDPGDLGIALDKGHLAVFDRDLDRTADRTHEAHAVYGFFHFFENLQPFVINPFADESRRASSGWKTILSLSEEIPGVTSNNHTIKKFFPAGRTNIFLTFFSRILNGIEAMPGDVFR